MALPSAPCDRDCPDRTPGCHDHCEAYQQWHAQIIEIREAIKQDKEIWGSVFRRWNHWKQR